MRLAPDEIAPRFDPASAPRLDLDQWPTERLLKANRNYAMDYLTSSYQALIDSFGVDEAIWLARRNGQLIGRQFYPEVRGGLGLDSADKECPDLDGFGTFLATFANAAGRIWDGLIAGFPATHDRFFSLSSDITENAFT